MSPAALHRYAPSHLDRPTAQETRCPTRQRPAPAILSGALMLDHLGLHDQAAQLREAVDATTGSGVLTREVGGTATTSQVVAAIIENLALGPAVP